MDSASVRALCLRLFHTKKGTRLSSSDADVGCLKSETAVSNLVSDNYKLDPTKKVAAVFGGDLGQETIHVLVQLPPPPLSREDVSVAVLRQQRATEQPVRASQIPLKRKHDWDDLDFALLPKRKKGGSVPFSAVEWELLPTRFKPVDVDGIDGEFYGGEC
ncbi:hypothetical protein BBJ28_00011122 [Nothophytophthora sp. Chile5]|nr:hypothetical protein BBJ28_00011122 [Nothophytophthora sp. Chile5]